MSLFSYEDAITEEYLIKKRFYLLDGIWWRPYAFGMNKDKHDILLYYKYQHNNGIMIVERDYGKEDCYNVFTTGDMEFVLNKYSK